MPDQAPPPALGYQLNAGLKTVARCAAALVTTVVFVIATEPDVAAAVGSILPVRWYGVFSALVVIAGAVHNHWNNRSKA